MDLPRHAVEVPPPVLDVPHTLTVGAIFPALGAPVHINHVLHQGTVHLHDHDFLEVAVVQGGAGLHHNIHGTVPLAAGDVILVAPGQWHGYDACRDLWLYNIGVAQSLLVNELSWLHSDPLLATLLFHRRTSGLAPEQRITIGRLGEEVRARVFAACESILGLQATGDHLRVRAEVIGHLCVALGSVARNLPMQRSSVGKVDEGVRDLIAAMERQLDHSWGLQELAHRLGVTPAYCVRRFRRSVGLAPLGWLTRRRTEAAAVLLATTDAPVGEIAHNVGWSDPNYFARRFRAVFGMNPSAYRQSRSATAPLAGG